MAAIWNSGMSPAARASFSSSAIKIKFGCDGVVSMSAHGSESWSKRAPRAAATANSVSVALPAAPAGREYCTPKCVPEGSCGRQGPGEAARGGAAARAAAAAARAAAPAEAGEEAARAANKNAMSNVKNMPLDTLFFFDQSFT